MQKQEEKSTVLGVWSALAAGFDLTAKHPWLLLLPILLDLFIWLGPRLRFQAIIEQIVANLPQETEVLTIATQLLEVGPRTNLFTTLSAPLVGVPVLLAGLSPEKTPITSLVWDIHGGVSWLLLFLALSLIGLFLTAVYYVTIAAALDNHQSHSGSSPAGQWAGSILKSWLRLVGLALLFLAIALIVYLPFSIIGALAFFLSATVGTIVLLFAPLVIIWVIIYLSFAPPGITINNRSLLQSVKESIQLVQGNLAVVLTMLLLTLLLGMVVDWLLILADNGTWLTVFNIVIHAFVNTALIAAFFLIYRNRAALLYAGETSLNKRL